MNVPDSSAWLEFFAGSVNGRVFAEAIRDTEHLLVPTIVVTEVRRRLWLQSTAEAVEAAEALCAARGNSAHDRDRGARRPPRCGAPPSARDSILYATTVAHDAELWTQDSDFDGLAGVRYIPQLR